MSFPVTVTKPGRTDRQTTNSVELVQAAYDGWTVKVPVPKSAPIVKAPSNG